MGEARVNGLADACVTIADQPLALYVNPALLTSTNDRKLLFNPLGFRFEPPERRGENIAPRIFQSFTSVGFIGYTQPMKTLGDIGGGLAGFQDEEGGRGLLVGAAYQLGFLHTGTSIGLRYLEYVPEGEVHLRPAAALGLAVPGIRFADVPGEISVAAALRYLEWFNVQAGLDYRIEFFRFLVNFNMRDPIEEGISLSTVHLAALFTLKDLLGFDAEFGGGWASDNRFGLLAAADLNLCRINLSYSNAQDNNGQIAFAFLFNIASTKEVAERLSSIEKEDQAKKEITSKTYTSQGIMSYNEGNYDAAIQAFDIALIWNPTNDEALGWIQRVRDEKRSSELRALLAAANAAMRSKDYLEAMSKAEAALGNAGEINELYQKGLEQYATGDYKGATETWGKIEKLQPRSTTVKTYKQKTSEQITKKVAEGLRQMESFERKRLWAQALTLAKQLKTLAPSNRTIATKISFYQTKVKTATSDYEREGIDYYNRGYFVQSQNSFYALLAVDPSNSTAKQYLERIKGKLQKKDANDLYMQGVQAYTNNNYKQAIYYWEQVLTINPNYENVARNIQRAKDKLAQLK
jgi:tetratricopeptide (TPR) repeat protein